MNEEYLSSICHTFELPVRCLKNTNDVTIEMDIPIYSILKSSNEI